MKKIGEIVMAMGIKNIQTVMMSNMGSDVMDQKTKIVGLMRRKRVVTKCSQLSNSLNDFR